MKGKVERRYDRFSLFYDFLDTFPGLGRAEERWRRHAIELLRIEEGNIIADIATGTGLILPWLAEKDRKGEIIGIDISREMLRRAERRVRVSGMNNFTIIRGDVERLPFRDSSIDRIISTFSLTTIPGYRESMDEMLRVMKDGGRGVILDTGKPKKAWSRFIHLLISPVARMFGRTHFERDIESYLAKRAKIIGKSEFYGGMVYALEFRKVKR